MVSTWLKLVVKMLRAGRRGSSRPPHQLTCFVLAKRLVQHHHQRAHLMLLLRWTVEVLGAASWLYKPTLLPLAPPKQSQHQKRATVRNSSKERALRPLRALPSTLERQLCQTAPKLQLHLGATSRRTAELQVMLAPLTRQSPLQGHQRCGWLLLLPYPATAHLLPLTAGRLPALAAELLWQRLMCLLSRLVSLEHLRLALAWLLGLAQQVLLQLTWSKCSWTPPTCSSSAQPQ